MESMTEHYALYSLAGYIRSIEAELALTSMPGYRRNNLQKLLTAMHEKADWLLDKHDRKQCARCANLRGRNQ